MKHFLSELAITLAITTIMSGLSGIDRCLAFKEYIERSAKRTRLRIRPK